MPADAGDPMRDPELVGLLGALRQARRHLAATCAGLSVEQLDAVLLPSGWTLRGKLEHMAVNERFWVRAIIGGDPGLVAELEAEPDDTWRFEPGIDGDQLAETYLAECAASDDVLSQVAPDQHVAWFPVDQFGAWRIDTVREVLHHLIVETATHAGHLDIVRELIDGTQYLVLE